jgi:hypothetical protein
MDLLSKSMLCETEKGNHHHATYSQIHQDATCQHIMPWIIRISKKTMAQSTSNLTSKGPHCWPYQSSNLHYKSSHINRKHAEDVNTADAEEKCWENAQPTHTKCIQVKEDNERKIKQLGMIFRV